VTLRDESDPPPPPPPPRLGGCRLARELGTGGWGAVYEAFVEQPRPWGAVGSRVAVKLLRADRFGDPTSVARFLREARLGRTVEHPSVVRTFDAGAEEHDGRRHHFLIMEYVEGRTFSRLLWELGVVPEALLRELALQTAEALAAIHAAGVVHRDLKPSNLLITPDHRVKVMDLGVAALLDPDDPAGAEPRITASGLFVGTLDYAAPEQLSGAPAAPAVDLYALGVVLHEGAVGKRVFDAARTRALVGKILYEKPPRVGQLNAQVTPFFEELIARLLEKDPAARFASAAELAETLREGVGSAWWRAREPELRAGQALGQLRRIAVPRETPFANRAHELGRLLELAASAAAGSGRTALVEGEAGVGKSRLVDELVRRRLAEDGGLRVLVGSDPPGGHRGLGGLARGLVESLGEAQLEARLVDLLGPLWDYAPDLARLLRGLPPLARGGAALDGEALPALFGALAAGLARDGRVIWVVEDLHFASAESRRLFAALAERCAELPLLLIGTVRAGFRAEEWSHFDRLPQVERVAVERLRDSDVEVMIAGIGADLSAEAARELRRQVLLKSDGNPFFVCELLRQFRGGDDRHATQPQASPTDATRPRRASTGPRALPALQIPSTVRDLLGVRLRGLDEADRALLDVAAAEGFEFDPEPVAAARGQGLLELLERLASIERRHGLVRATGSGFRFDHHLLQELIYEALPPALRRAYHRALAEAHRALAGRSAGAGDERAPIRVVEHELYGEILPAAEPLLSALERLAAAYQTERVLELIERALPLVGTDAPALEAELCLRAADRWFLLHRGEAHRLAVERALEAARRAGDAGREARALYERGRMLVDGGEAEALPLLERALEVARAAGDARTEARVQGALGHVALRTGDFALARERYARQAETAGAAGDVESEAEARYYEGEALLGVSAFAEARAVLGASVERCRRHGFRRVEARATADLALAEFFLGEYAAARELYGRGLELAVELGSRETEALAHANFCVLATLEGDLGEARLHNDAHLELARDIESPFHEAYGLLYRGEIDRLAGDLDGAERTLGSAAERFAALGFHLGALEAAFHLGRLHLDRGRRDEAVERFAAAERIALEHGLRDPAPLPTLYLALLGERALEGLEVPDGLQLPLAAEAHWVLDRAGAPGDHAARARRGLERIAAHLAGARRDRFWSTHPVARALARTGGSGP
jgi:tetratricopeptide (TPR) repeat protein